MGNDKLTELQLELSVKCNSNCIMCPRNKLTRDGKPGFMSFNLAKKIIDEAYDMGARLLKPQWFGEPLLSPDFEKIVGYAKNKGMRIMLITNGSLLDEKKRDFVLKNCNKIFFSIDSADKDRYEGIRRGLKFDKVVANLEALFKKKNASESEAKIFVTADDLGKGGMDELRKYFEGMCDQVIINKEVLHSVEVKTEDFRKVVCRHSVRNRLVVGWDGTPYLCCHDWLGEYPLPNLQARRIKDIWNCCKRSLYLRNLTTLQICQKCMSSLEQ